MIKQQDQIILDKILTIKKNTSEERMRIELYSVIIYLILDKRFFSKNSEIRKFLLECGDEFSDLKPYLFKSKTLLLSRILRKVENANKTLLYNMVLESRIILEKGIITNSEEENNLKYYHKSPNPKENKRSGTRNYTDELFNLFDRGEK